MWEKVQGFTDPILDPLVDLVVAGLAGLLGMPISNNTISSATNNSMPRTALSGSHSSFLENISSSSSIPDLLLINNTVINNNTSSSNASSSIVSSFDSPIILSSWLHLSPSFQYISTGYLIISLLLYHQARQYGYLNNPYLHTLKRTCKKWMVNIFLGFKVNLDGQREDEELH